MALPVQDQQQQTTPPPSDKELNFRKQEEMFQRKLEQERQARQAAEEKLEKLAQERFKPPKSDEDEEDYGDEPYVDHKRLKRELGRVAKKTIDETDTRIQNAVQNALAEERQKMWLKQNPDFYEVMNHAQAFAERDPELAESILEMPKGFEREKLVYKNIKALGLHKKPEDQPKIQDKIEQNRRSPYYQPSGASGPGYGIVNGGKDISPLEGQNAYKKMQELKARLRI
jgi:hypothetical protein